MGFCGVFLVNMSLLLLSPRVHTRTPSQQAPQEEVVDRAQPSCSLSPPGADLPPPPSNSFELESQLHKIGKQPEVVYRYLRVSKTCR